MDAIKPYLFWIVLLVVLVGLAVIRFGPVSAIERSTKADVSTYKGVESTLKTWVAKGGTLRRQAWIDYARKMGRKYAGQVGWVENVVVDFDSEFWPETNAIDFANPPTGTDLTIAMLEFNEVDAAVIKDFRNVIYFANADPAAGPHTIRLGRDALPHIDNPGSHERALPAILLQYRYMWLYKELARILTNPKLEIKEITGIDCPPPDGAGMPQPASSKSGDRPFMLPMQWGVNVTIPIKNLPVLMGDLESSRRHLKVMDFSFTALEEAIVNVKGMKPDDQERELALQGRLVKASLAGLSYDFLISRARLLYAADILDWRGLCAGLVPDGSSDQPGPARRVWTLLDDKAREAVRRVAALKKDEAPQPDDRRTILAALNTQIKNVDFYEAASFDGLTLDSETTDLLNRRDSLSEKWVQRLNRLLLQQAFPKGIGKEHHGWPT